MGPAILDRSSSARTPSSYRRAGHCSRPQLPFESNGYRGNDLTIFASHLFDLFTLSDWDYQQVPNSIVWIVRNDGQVLGLTYIPEQQILGWHHHDFGDDLAENVATIPEGNEDLPYFVVNRTINGTTKRYIER